MNFKNIRIVCVLLSFLFIGLTGIQAQSTIVLEHEATDLLPEAVQAATDLQINNPTIHGTYTEDDVLAVITKDLLEQMEAGYDNASDYDKVKFYYYQSTLQHALEFSIPVESPMVYNLKPSRAESGVALSDVELRNLYNELKLALDQI